MSEGTIEFIAPSIEVEEYAENASIKILKNIKAYEPLKKVYE